MPVRLNAKGRGEFIRDHLQEPSTGGRDYVGSMYQAYKDHLRSAGVRKHPRRATFHKRICESAPGPNPVYTVAVRSSDDGRRNA